MHESLKYRHLKGLKNGDRTSFRWIYDEYHALIYRYCFKFLRQKTLAQEATADVFIVVWQKRHLIVPDQPFTPLLFKIGKDIAYNYLKKISRNKTLIAHYLATVMDSHHENGETIFMEKEALEALQKAIEDLPPKRKKIFKLRYYEGLNNKDIAQKMQISINTVREQLAQARRFLKQYISNS